MIKAKTHTRTHARTHARTRARIKSKKKTRMTETRTRIDFFQLIKQKIIMCCCLPTELQRTLTKWLKVTYIMYYVNTNIV